MKFVLLLILTAGLFSFSSNEIKEPVKKITDRDLRTMADSLAKNIMIIDTHIDVPYRLSEHWEDISKRTKRGNFDYVRAKEGGLNVAFMSIYTSAESAEKGTSKSEAEKLIIMVKNIVKENAGKFELAMSVAESQNNLIPELSLSLWEWKMVPRLKIKLIISNTFMIKEFRYITLTHFKNNRICDSSTEEVKKWNGLSPFGKKVIEEMNRLGIMIDVSHISDDAFYQVLKITKAPLIASHSSCRFFTPGWEHNMFDEMIKVFGKKRWSNPNKFWFFIFKGEEIRNKINGNNAYINKYIKEKNLTEENAAKFRTKYLHEHRPGYASVNDVVKHIEHVVKLVCDGSCWNQL